MVLAVDFDGTIVEALYPGIGELRKDTKKIINKLHLEGHYIIIWTCRTGTALQEAKDFLIANEIRFHLINEHHPEALTLYGESGPKIGADYYIDDKSIEGLSSWRRIYNIIKRKEKCK